MYPRLRSSSSATSRSLCLILAYGLMLSFVTPMSSARGHLPSRNQGGSNDEGNDKPVPKPGAPAGKRLPNIDQARGQRHSPPKAPTAIPSSRPKWSPSSLPSLLIPPAVPVTPEVITGNTESAGLVFNGNSDPDASFAAQHGLLAAAAAGFRDTLPPIYWSTAISPIISDAYSTLFATLASKERQPLRPEASASGLSMVSLPNPIPFERLIISEFRFRGPAGVADEYIQLTNITGQSITVSTAD